MGTPPQDLLATATVDATVGGASATSYLTLAELAAYVTSHAGAQATHAGGTPATRAAALVRATQRLDLEPWAGAPATSTQRLLWPRVGVPDPDRPGERLYSDELPRRLRIACAELALVYLGSAVADDTAPALDAPDPLRDVAREKVDVLETEYRAHRVDPDALVRWPAVWRPIAPLLAGAALGGVGRPVGGYWARG